MLIGQHRHEDENYLSNKSGLKCARMDGKTAVRRLGQWALAYSGQSMVISRALQRAVRDAAHGNVDAGDELIVLMEEVLPPY